MCCACDSCEAQDCWVRLGGVWRTSTENGESSLKGDWQQFRQAPHPRKRLQYCSSGERPGDAVCPPLPLSSRGLCDPYREAPPRVAAASGGERRDAVRFVLGCPLAAPLPLPPPRAEGAAMPAARLGADVEATARLRLPPLPPPRVTARPTRIVGVGPPICLAARARSSAPHAGLWGALHALRDVWTRARGAPLLPLLQSPTSRSPLPPLLPPVLHPARHLPRRT